MIAASRHERGLCPVPLRQLETKDSAIKPQRPFQVGDLQMDVTDADLGINRAGRFVSCHGWFFAFIHSRSSAVSQPR
ncbi:hypothetical protein D1872_331790 [compost metagenome]